jgi:hypothetical protein
LAPVPLYQLRTHLTYRSVNIDTGKGTYSRKGIAWIILDSALAGPSPQATDSIVVVFALIYFSRFPPKKRMSSPKTI